MDANNLFFYVSKVTVLLTQPTALLVMLLVWGLWARAMSFRRRGNARVAWAGALLAIAAFLPVGNWLLIPLENRFERPLLGEVGVPDGFIVLGGAVDTVVSKAREMPALNSAAERVTAMLALRHRFPLARIIYTGGSADILLASTTEAEVMRQLMEESGIAATDLEFEGAARNTAENAALVRARLLAGTSAAAVTGRWLLVTSAFHMPRAMGVFRQAGFDVIAYPVDYRTRGNEDRWRFLDAPSDNLGRLDLAVHEWLGLFAYRLTGRTAEVLPAP